MGGEGGGEKEEVGPRGEGVGERDRGSIMWEDEGKNGGMPRKDGARMDGEKAKGINYAIFCRPAISISPPSHPTPPRCCSLEPW